MKSSDIARMELPLMATGAERAQWLRQLRDDLFEACDENVIDRYIADVDAKATPRPRIALPAAVDPQRAGIRNTTLLELAVPRPLQFSMQNGVTQCHANGMSWSIDAEFVARLGLFNDRKPHSIGELSGAPDIRLTGLIGIMTMTGVLRRVADAKNV
jgi:hypothetical protein